MIQIIRAFLYLFYIADGCRHWERHSGAMEAQAQWAGKLLQEYQRRAEASGFPGPNNEGPPQNKDCPVKTVQGMNIVTLNSIICSFLPCQFGLFVMEMEL